MTRAPLLPPLAAAFALALLCGPAARGDYVLAPTFVRSVDASGLTPLYADSAPGRVGFGTGTAARHEIDAVFVFDLTGVVGATGYRLVGTAEALSHVLAPSPYADAAALRVALGRVAAPVPDGAQALWAALNAGPRLAEFYADNGVPSVFGTPGVGGAFDADLGLPAGLGASFAVGAGVSGRYGAGSDSVQADLTGVRLVVASPVPEPPAWPALAAALTALAARARARGGRA